MAKLGLGILQRIFSQLPTARAPIMARILGRFFFLVDPSKQGDDGISCGC